MWNVELHDAQLNVIRLLSLQVTFLNSSDFLRFLILYALITVFNILMCEVGLTNQFELHNSTIITKILISYLEVLSHWKTRTMNGIYKMKIHYRRPFSLLHSLCSVSKQVTCIILFNSNPRTNFKIILIIGIIPFYYSSCTLCHGIIRVDNSGVRRVP